MDNIVSKFLTRMRTALARVSQLSLATLALVLLVAGRMWPAGASTHAGATLDLLFDLLAAGTVALLAVRAYRSQQREKRFKSLAERHEIALINTSAELEQATQSEKEAQAARRDAERSYRSIFENANEGIFQTSPEGHYLNANPALAKMYGYETPEHLMAGLTNIAGQLYVDPTRRAAFRLELLATDRVRDFASQIRRRDGTLIWISENARAVRDDAGELLYYEGTVNDITARREAEDAMHSALAEAEQASRAKVAFLAAMSHELRTPLNAVIGFSEILKEQRLGPIGLNKYLEFAGDIHANGQRLLARINDILDLTRIEGGGASLDFEDVPLDQTIGEAMAQAYALQDAAQSDYAPVVVDISPTLPALKADRKRLRQIFKILLDNALKFTPESGMITVRATQTPSGINILIEDTGIGMIPERIPVALEPFKQLDSSLSRRFEGIGLGLPIARALTVLHGGTLAIESMPSVGTVVTVYFPKSVLCAPPPSALGLEPGEQRIENGVVLGKNIVGLR